MIDVLIPTRGRPVELATTLAGLAAQTGVAYRLTISDQSDGDPSWETPSAWTVIRWLRRRGVSVDLHRHLLGHRRLQEDHRRLGHHHQVAIRRRHCTTQQQTRFGIELSFCQSKN